MPMVCVLLPRVFVAVWHEAHKELVWQEKINTGCGGGVANTTKQASAAERDSQIGEGGANILQIRGPSSKLSYTTRTSGVRICEPS